MAKSKSSASSATRKKHARKAATGQVDEPQLPKEKKASKKEKKSKVPRKKVYIPPIKPAPVRPDPLDTLGIAQKLPPELLVILRRFAKKDSITKRRALEDFHSGWVDKARSSVGLLDVIAETLPVWLHHVPALFLHPSRRIRLLSVGLHSSLLRLLSEQLFFNLREVLTVDEAEYILGSWLLAAHDIDRQVASLARDCWTRCVSLSAIPRTLTLDTTLTQHLWDFVHRTLLDPGGVYLYINPPQATVAPPPSHKKGAKAIPLKKAIDEDTGRARSEEEEENEADRRARLRMGACGSAEWMLNTMASERPEALKADFVTPFANPALWSVLYHAQNTPFVDVESFGWNQPGVRRAAWSLLQVVLAKCQGDIDPLLQVLSSAILRSAWVEPDPNVRAAMWQPLLTFLREHPVAWSLDMRRSQDDEGDEDEENEDEDGQPREAQAHDSAALRVPSAAYRELLQFLELGCSGSPLQGYPTVIVIISTIPPSIFGSSSSTPLDDLFTSFWAAVDGRALSALDRAATSAAFFSALLECLAFLVRRLVSCSPGDALLLVHGAAAECDLDEARRKQVAERLVAEQYTRSWEALSERRLRVEADTAAGLMAKSLTALYQLDHGLFTVAWEALSSAILAASGGQDGTISPIASTILKSFQRAFEQGSEQDTAVKGLVAKVIHHAIRRCEKILQSDEPPANGQMDALVGVLNALEGSIFSDKVVAQSIDDTIRDHLRRVLDVAPSLLLVYLCHRHDDVLCSRLWQDVLRTLAGSSGSIEDVVSPLLKAQERGELPEYLRAEEGDFDDVVGDLLAGVLTGTSNTSEVSILRSIMRSPGPFVSMPSFNGLVESLVSALNLHFPAVWKDATLSLSVFGVSWSLVEVFSTHHLAVLQATAGSTSLFAEVFLFANLLPSLRTTDHEEVAAASRLWQTWLLKATGDVRSNTVALVRERLREMLLDCSGLASPQHILQVLTTADASFDVDPLHDILPSRISLDDMLGRLPSVPGDSSLAVLDALIPPASLYTESGIADPEVDASGLSEYARVVEALLLILLEDRHMAKTTGWALRHLLALALYADDLLRVPNSRGSVFAATTSKVMLNELIARARQIATYVLSSSPQDDGWHTAVVNAITAEKENPGLDAVGTLVYDLVSDGKRFDTVRESRILHVVLEHTLGNASKDDADQWVQLGRRMERQAPHMSIAIVYSVTQHAPEPSLLDRYRNELAAGVYGVPASKANTQGLWLLRRLAATAPDPESDVVFLPQNRAVNLMKTCQQWITSDEDIDEDVESEMTLVFLHLVPILQNVPGAHWDLIFDVMENNLENSSLVDQTSLVVLSRTLRLLIAIQDLASTNKALRELWTDRENTSLTFVRDIVAVKLGPEQISAPLSACRELALQIVQDLPESLMDAGTISKMCHIVEDPVVDVQKMAYRLLHEAARKYTEYMVIEAAVESEEPMKIELPLELVQILQRDLAVDESLDFEHQHSSGYFLAWMLAFDHFANASLKVKSAYIEQLRDLGLVGDRLLPSVIATLGLHGGNIKPFRLDIWSIEDMYLDSYSGDSALSVGLLAAHLYYRALLIVPSLIRSWLSECRDRQLLTRVSTYTATHFSPAIIRTELAEVRDPDAAAELADEDLSIKVANAVNEVTAAYAVDEYTLSLTVKLPSDYPLHGIEIRDSKPVGVPEDRWRAWMLGIQQIISYRSGSITDGLSFFKKNVSSHFAGLAECAICYSVISAMDGSLPRKPCRTCKNRFHAGCLYKWFNSSHSSSCPLCRSEII